MKKRTLLLFILLALLVSIPARADLIEVQFQVRSSAGALLYSASSFISDPAVEFKPWNQISFDFTGEGNVIFRPLVNAKFSAYDAIFTVTTPDFFFSGVSPLTPASTMYAVSYDQAQHAVIFHHNAGADTTATWLQFHVPIQQAVAQVKVDQAPEPSSLILLGTGLMFAAGVLRRRLR